MSDDTRQAQAIDAVAKSAIAALAKVLAYARSGQTAMTPDEYWGYLHESYRLDYVRQARLMLESAFAADAVGRERVRSAGIDEQALEAAVWAVSARRWHDPNVSPTKLDRTYATAAITAYLTAAPPERHDAPGVSEQEAESLIHAYHDTFQALWRNPFNLENIDRAQAAHLALKDALTGSPDAEQCIHRIGAPACRKGLGCGCMRGEAPELPDAGRDPDAKPYNGNFLVTATISDPDAADAGGE